MHKGVVLQRRLELTGGNGSFTWKTNLRVLSISAFATIGGVLYGYNQGMFSGLLAMPSFQNHMGEWDPMHPTKHLDKKGWLTSILELGAWLGALLSGFLAETISRKYSILVAACIFMVGVSVQLASLAVGHEAILAGRFITGMGVGILSSVVPIYNSECAPPEIRGSLVALQQLSICFGIMISFWIDYGTNFIGGTAATSQSTASWIVPISLQLVPAAILVVGMAFMPFSPRWLVHHDREAEARIVLSKLRSLPENHELVQLELLEIKCQSTFERRNIAEKYPNLQKLTPWNIFKLQFVTIKSLLMNKHMHKRIMVATVSQVFQQWSGINAILYYSPTIYKQLGLDSNTTSLLATGVTGILLFLATIPAVLWIDRIGRRPALIAGAVGMATSHITIAGILGKYQTEISQHPAAGWVAIVMVWLYVVHFGYSWGPCAWILLAEVWPMSIRPYGVALGSSINWMNNFIVGQVTPDMLGSISYGTFIIYGLLILIGGIWVWLLVPETKRLTLEEMDTVFGSKGVAQAEFEKMDEISRELGLVTTRDASSPDCT